MDSFEYYGDAVESFHVRSTGFIHQHKVILSAAP